MSFVICLYCRKQRAGFRFFFVYLSEDCNANFKGPFAVFDADHWLASFPDTRYKVLQFHLEGFGLREDGVFHDLNKVSAALPYTALYRNIL